MEPFLPPLLIFFTILSCLEITDALRRRQNKKKESESVVDLPSRDEVVDDLYIVHRTEGPREVMGLMTVKEVMDILEREPKFEVVLDMRDQEEDVLDALYGPLAIRQRVERDKEDRRAKRMLERMTREEILAVLDRRGSRPTMEEKRNSMALIDTILKIGDYHTAGRTYDSELVSLMDEARNALNRCSIHMDSERIVKRLAAALLEAWTDRPGRRRAESARFDRVVTAALDILERRTQGKSNTSTYELRVAASLEALNREASTASPYKDS